MSQLASRSAARLGRRPVATHDELEQIAFTLFDGRGFAATTVDDVARAAGIGRRTFFRYYASKNDLAWGRFDGHLDRLREHLAQLPADLPLADQVLSGVLAFNQCRRRRCRGTGSGCC